MSLTYPYSEHVCLYSVCVVPLCVLYRDLWQASKGEAELTELFKSLDTEGKGFLGVTEVTALARQYYDGREPTEKKVTEIMSRMGHGTYVLAANQPTDRSYLPVLRRYCGLAKKT